MKLLSDAFSPEVMAELAKPVMSYDPRNAELFPGVMPAWYVIETYAHCERQVAEELITRRFGIFIPEEEETIIRRGRKIDIVQLMFPGYIFVFVWDIAEHLARIKAVAGVLQVIFVDGKPAVVSDEMIDRIRAVENSKRPIPGLAPRKAKPKKRWRRSRKVVDPDEFDDEIVATYPWSAFQNDLITLDSDGRNQSLRKALGLSSVPAHVCE